MNCSYVEKILLDFLDGDLTLPEYLRVKGHLSSCYRCQEACAVLEEVSAATREVCLHPAPVNRFAEFNHLFPKDEEEPKFIPVVLIYRRRRRKRRNRGLGLPVPFPPFFVQSDEI